MKLYKEENISNFNFWSGAKQNSEMLTEEEFTTIENMLDELYPDGMSETQLNDLFWFDEDTVAEWLGYESFEEIINRE